MIYKAAAIRWERKGKRKPFRYLLVSQAPHWQKIEAELLWNKKAKQWEGYLTGSVRLLGPFTTLGKAKKAVVKIYKRLNKEPVRRIKTR